MKQAFKLICLPFFFTIIFLSSPVFSQTPTVYYIAVGDSYTVGEAVEKAKTWPSLLINHLQSQNIHLKLVALLAKSGWTTQDIIRYALPEFRSRRPDFATLLIGVNDWVSGVDENTFRQNFSLILDRMLEALPSKDRLMALTIPDFSATPRGKLYSYGRDISRGIRVFNQIIIEECSKRKIKAVNIFTLSQGMKNNRELIAADGLHPSAKEYLLWEEVVYQRALDVFQKTGYFAK